MSVTRFRSFDEAQRALWVKPGDPDLGRRIRRLWARARRLAPADVPRGVRKFRTIEEAGRDRQRWVEKR